MTIRPPHIGSNIYGLLAGATLLLATPIASADSIPLNSGTAAQSSQLGGFGANNALDSTVNFTHTRNSDSNATWQVLLPDSFSFGEIEVFNRGASGGSLSCCPSRFRDITIQVVDFSGNVASDFTGGTVTHSSPLLNPENVIGGGSASSGPVSLTTDALGASGNMIRIVRTPDPNLSGSGGAGNADEANVLSLDLVTAEGSQGINTFTANPETIASGESLTLTWNVATDATALAIDQGVGSVLPNTTNGLGTIQLNPGPAVTTTYQLSLTQPGVGVTTAEVTVTIDNTPHINFFTGQHPSVAPGTTLDLTWDVDHADQLLLDGVEVTGLTTTIVAPLVSTTYTLTANNAFGSSNAQVTVEVVNVPNFVGSSGRFVEVVKNDLSNTLLHLSEIEVYQFGVTPNNAHADGTSGNDLVQAGNPSTQAPPTTTSLAHGSAASVFDGDLESGAAVWTTNNGLGTKARYMLDLGATQSIGVVRLFGREDTCCLERLQNVTVNVYADDGAGNPGTLINSATFPGTAPAGSAGHLELDLALLDPGIRNFIVDKSFIPVGESITLTWVVNTTTTSVSIDQGVGDVTGLTNPDGTGSIVINPGPTVSKVYTLTADRPSGTSVSSVSVEVTDQPLIYSFTGDASLIAPGTSVVLTWSVTNIISLELNGSNVTGTTGTTITPNLTTTYLLTATNANGVVSAEVRIQVVLPGEPVISEFMADNENGLLDQDGEPSDWIEICNPTATPTLLAGYFLTDDPNNLTKWQFPAVTIPAGDYLVVFATGNDRALPGAELHTNFSLDRNGEYLALVRPDGSTIINEFAPFPNQRADVSYGFDLQALQEGYFLTPSPGSPNPGGFSGFVADTEFSLDRGFYDTPIAVAITSDTSGAEIRYTVDGSKPTATTGLAYTMPVPISQTTVLRAAAFNAGMVPTNVDTQTYIFAADVIDHPNMRTSITQHATYGPQMAASLQAIPTISLVFQGDVERSEKETSIEFINFEAGNSQVDAGMERFGSYVTNFAKRSMRVNFRSDYGPKKLTFPVFDGHEYQIPPADRFDSIDLRAGNHDMSARGAYMSNRFVDDAMIDMGQIAPHGRFVHLYLNGLYWGQYHLRERWNGSMLSEYFGGSKDQYEAINANNSGSEFQTGVPYDGTGQYWTETRNRVAGPNPFSNSLSHLDIPDVTDFMLLWVSGNSESEFRSAGAVPLRVPFKFFMKDADGFLRSPGHSASHNGPLNVMTEMRSEGDPDYETLVADRIHKHFFNDGTLTPARNIARLQARVDECQLSFYSEAARWDFRTPSSWQSYQNNLLNNHFVGLTNTMIGRFQSAGMYPSTVAPSFNQHGGGVPAGFQLVITAPQGTIYYTLDGSDPRVAAEPIENDPPTVLVTEAAAKRIYIPATATDGLIDGTGKEWNEVGYDDGSWTQGTGGVGYDSGAGDRYGEFIDIDTEAVMDNLRTSCLVRIPFTPALGSLDGMTNAEIRVRYDDGYVAYLNGTEIWRENFTETPDGDSRAGTSHSDNDAVNRQPVDISAHLGLIIEGQENVLSFHGLNISTGSSDFLLSADLRISTSPGGGGPSGAISPTAIAYTGSVPITTVTRVGARVLNGANWSALNEATFVPMQDFSNLVVSEFMYNPPSATPAEIAAGFNDSEDFEFLELLNTGSEVLDLNGLRFIDGIAFKLTGSEITTLAPGARVLIVEDREAFEFRYGTGLPIAGQYTGKLKDEGETVLFVDALDLPVRLFTYDNNPPWPTAAAGLGASLSLINPAALPNHNVSSSWQASVPGGTPGGADTPPMTYPTWAAGFGITDPSADLDSDGVNNFLEFVFLSDPSVGSSLIGRLSVDLQSLDLGFGPEDYLILSIQHRITVTELELTPEVSSDLLTWDDGPGSAVLYSRIYHGDGAATSIYRSATPLSALPRGFIRARFEIP